MKKETENKGSVRLQGVSRIAFDALPSYPIEASPPERLQVWALQNGGGAVTLHAPEKPGAEMLYIPMYYSFSWTGTKDDVGSLRIDLPEAENYVDGALEYQSGALPAIPVPRSGLNRAIPLKCRDRAAFRVQPSEGFESMYRRRS